MVGCTTYQGSIVLQQQPDGGTRIQALTECDRASVLVGLLCQEWHDLLLTLD